MPPWLEAARFIFVGCDANWDLLTVIVVVTVMDESHDPKYYFIGYWRTLKPWWKSLFVREQDAGGRGQLPDPRKFVDRTWDEGERRAVIEWLKSGVLFASYGGWSDCRLCGRMNGSTELTDGLYIWPAGLVHYVEAHHVRLPARLVRRALEVERVDPRVVPPDHENRAIIAILDKKIEADMAWWVATRSYRDP